MRSKRTWVSTVTAIETRKAQRNRVVVFLDGSYAFSISSDLAAQMGLAAGQTLSASDIARIKDADQFERCMNSALTCLGPRPRSREELRARLKRGGFDTGTIQKVLHKLAQEGLIDDAAFARYWLQNRETFRPRSRRLLEAELRRKGLDAETVTQAVSTVDESESALRAARKRAPRLVGLSYPEFRRRLGAYLRRRGFAFELIDQIIDQVREEHGNPR